MAALGLNAVHAGVDTVTDTVTGVVRVVESGVEEAVHVVGAGVDAVADGAGRLVDGKCALAFVAAVTLCGGKFLSVQPCPSPHAGARDGVDHGVDFIRGSPTQAPTDLPVGPPRTRAPGSPSPSRPLSGGGGGGGRGGGGGTGAGGTGAAASAGAGASPSRTAQVAMCSPQLRLSYARKRQPQIFGQIGIRRTLIS